MPEVKVIQREALFVKKKDIGEKLAKKLISNNTFLFFEDRACEKCEFLEERLASDTKLAESCHNCAGFKGGVALAKEVKIGDNTYVSVPSGDEAGLEKTLAKYDLVWKSKRKTTDFKRCIKFTGTLKDFQEEAVKAAIKKKYGIIKAPPRSGKTVLSTAMICRLGKKTIIMAAQREWLDGFYETFCGSDTQAPLTNAKKDQIGFAKKYEDFLKYDVCLVTYQTFHSEKGQKLLAKIRDMFTVCVIDEVHMTGANKFAAAISKLSTKYLIGLSGTPTRKDMRHVICHALIGPIIYNAKVERLRPIVRLIKTDYKKTVKGNVPWVRMVSGLERDPKRLKLIAQWALKDVKDKHMILIPLAQLTPIKALVMAINKMAGKKVAHAFHGGLKKDVRKKLIQDARTYKVRIIVGTTKLVSVGINIPRASAIYEVSMSSNRENCEQRVARVLTPMDDKPPPIVRIFLDDFNIRRRCLNNEWFNCIKPKFKPIIAEKDEIALKAYLSQKDSKNLLAAWEV